MKFTAIVTLGAAALIYAQETVPGVTYFSGLTGTQGVDQTLASQYATCLTKELSSRGAVQLSLASPSEWGAPCNSNCLQEARQSAGINRAFSGELRKNANGFQAVLRFEGAGVTQTDWMIIGDTKQLMSDGCKNGAGVIYNALITPPRKNIQPPPGYQAEVERDRGMNANVDVFEKVEADRAKASRGGASSNTNPDSDKSGKTGR
jgi:hypothetical protein